MNTSNLTTTIANIIKNPGHMINTEQAPYICDKCSFGFYTASFVAVCPKCHNILNWGSIGKGVGIV